MKEIILAGILIFYHFLQSSILKLCGNEVLYVNDFKNARSQSFFAFGIPKSTSASCF